MTSIESVRSQLDEIFSQHQSVRISDGRYGVSRGTSQCVVWAEEGIEECWVHFEATVLMEVPITDRLVWWVATNDSDHHLYSTTLEDFKNGHGAVLLKYALRGRDLQSDDVLYAVQTLVEVADLIDEGAQEAFGGNLASHYSR